MPNEPFDLLGLPVGRILESLRQMSLGSALWLVGLLASGTGGVWTASHWWTLQSLPQVTAPVSVVPPTQARRVGDLPAAAAAGTNLLKDISVFDLRSWTPTRPQDTAGRNSPVNYINYLHLKKTRAVDKYVIHYGTGGYAIDLRCITHAFTVLERQPSPQHSQGKEYALTVDISSEPIDREFLLVVEATYWNGFSNPKEETASTYTDTDIDPLGELALIVLFPDNKPFTDYQLLAGPSDSEARTPYRGLHSFYADTNKRFIYWSIRERRPEYHYTLNWKW